MGYHKYGRWFPNLCHSGDGVPKSIIMVMGIWVPQNWESIDLHDIRTRTQGSYLYLAIEL